ncbi:MAG: hypothetical protein SFV32_01880 [Opitutaceae bacterium]|nr:hypothetical protein [Opitutaceae bacterium]
MYPVIRLVAERKVRLVLASFAFFGVAGGLAGVLCAIHMLKAPQTVFVLDAAGNITTGPLERVGPASPLFTAIATQATLQFFSRGPGGLDNEEWAQRLFTPECFDRVLQDVRDELPELEAKDLRYRPEIRDYDFSIPDDHGRHILRVGGFYTVSGSVDGLALHDKRDFRLTLALIPNPDFAGRGMYPFVVSAFKKVVEP